MSAEGGTKNDCIDLSRCDWCGWPLKESVEDGCIAINCSMRPMPELTERGMMRQEMRRLRSQLEQQGAILRAERHERQAAEARLEAEEHRLRRLRDTFFADQKRHAAEVAALKEQVPGAACAKCRAIDIGTSYHKTDYDCGYGAISRPRDEHLHRVCRTCHFDWTAPVHSPGAASK